MTSWITSVFATNDQSGFGIAENIPKITVRNDFFITMDLPETIVQGEEFLLQVTVFNYLPSTQQVSVQIQHSDDMNHPIPAASITMVDSIGNTIDSLILLSLQLEVNSGEGKSTYVHFTPTSTGSITLTAEARAGDLLRAAAVDQVQKQVDVVPYGIIKRENVQELVNLTHGSSSHLSVSLQDPPHMAPGSKTVTVKMTGNFMKPSIDGLQRLLKMPHGCGEQNMVDFAPDVYIAKYLKTVGQLTKEVEGKAVQQVKFGYQNELRNMHRDGSFSAFGKSDLSGSTWLTAFVLKCFGQARSIVKVDDQVLSRSMVWLLGQQDQDGSFREPGTSMRWVDQSGTQTGVSHTAFILIAMLENRGFKLVADSRLNNAITKAMHYLEAQINGPHDMYTVAVLCYAIAKSGSSISPSCFNKLQTGAFNQGDKTYWQHSRMVNKRANSRMAPSRAPSRDIEATSYALLTYSELGKLNEGRKVVNWLVSQRNPSGGFASTQDTVVSLQALSEFAARFPMDPSSFPNYGLHLNTTGNNFVHEYQITPATYDISYSFEVPSNVPSIDIYTTGEGVAVIDVTTSYYIQSDLQDPRISISATIIKESLNSLTVHNCMRWTGPTPSGMLLMEVERPTGFMTDVDKLNVQTTIKRQERNGRFHVLYFDSLAVNSQVCVDVKMDRSDPVVKSQACHVMVYDYYEPSYQAVTTYESGILKSTTICQVCPLCEWCNELSFPQIGVGR
ncbi:CD109 antigen-like [Mya arenaria]|uniref:CD109 antigen-like n=1 Tax=Mya arenaria TaxID=6604 RepID=UPI0022E81FB9|nr:CD109 antigen-like [Mya arenaria]